MRSYIKGGVHLDRFTQRAPEGGFLIPNTGALTQTADAYTGDAVDKLAKFENVYEDLRIKQEEITRELSLLRDAGKAKSLQFRELMGKKLNNSYALNLFKMYDL